MSGFGGGGSDTSRRKRIPGPVSFLSVQHDHKLGGGSFLGTAVSRGGQRDSYHPSQSSEVPGTAWSQRSISIRPDTASTVDEPPVDPGMVHFGQAPWLEMCNYLGIATDETWLQSLRRTLGCTVSDVLQGLADLRVNKLACVITAMTHTLDGSVSVTLMDPTGKVNGYVHTDLIEEYGPELAVGCVMILSKVAIFLSGPGVQRWLNIVPNNIIGFYPKKLEMVDSSSMVMEEGQEMRFDGEGHDLSNHAAGMEQEEEDAHSVMMQPAESNWMEEELELDHQQHGGGFSPPAPHPHPHHPGGVGGAAVEGGGSSTMSPPPLLNVSFGWGTQERREEATSILGSTTAAFAGGSEATAGSRPSTASSSLSLQRKKLTSSDEPSDIWDSERPSNAGGGGGKGGGQAAAATANEEEEEEGGGNDEDFLQGGGGGLSSSSIVASGGEGGSRQSTSRPIPVAASSREVSSSSSRLFTGSGSFNGPSSLDSLSSMVAQPDDALRGAWDYYDDEEDDLGGGESSSSTIGGVGGQGGGGGEEFYGSGSAGLHHSFYPQHAHSYHPGGGSSGSSHMNRPYSSSLHRPSPSPFHRSAPPLRMPLSVVPPPSQPLPPPLPPPSSSSATHASSSSHYQGGGGRGSGQIASLHQQQQHHLQQGGGFLDQSIAGMALDSHLGIASSNSNSSSSNNRGAMLPPERRVPGYSGLFSRLQPQAKVARGEAEGSSSSSGLFAGVGRGGEGRQNILDAILTDDEQLWG